MQSATTTEFSLQIRCKILIFDRGNLIFTFPMIRFTQMYKNEKAGERDGYGSGEGMTGVRKRTRRKEKKCATITS